VKTVAWSTIKTVATGIAIVIGATDVVNAILVSARFTLLIVGVLALFGGLSYHTSRGRMKHSIQMVMTS
jgi:hypothetical protein